MTSEEFFTWLKQEHGGEMLAVKDFGDGRYGGVKRLIYHYTLVVGMIGNTETMDDRYCYTTRQLAEDALAAWDGTGDPVNWHRHPTTGRRRPDGDAAREYIGW